MQTFLITANDTDVGKTRVTALLAAHFAALGQKVQIVKAIDCGGSNDAINATRAAGSPPNISPHTLLSFPEPLAPLAPGNHHGKQPILPRLLDGLTSLPPCDVRLIESAGGVAVPIDPDGSDWRDLAEAIQPQSTIVVIDNRLGGINQGRLLQSYLRRLPHYFILNETQAAKEVVKASNAEAYAASEMPLLARLEYNAEALSDFEADWLSPQPPTDQTESPCEKSNPSIQRLRDRKKNGHFRSLPEPELPANCLNLADNDYLGLRHHPDLILAGQDALRQWGTSSSASPLITGYTRPHADLEATISNWHQGAPTLLWNSGYAANQSILQRFILPGDLVLADRLIHNSLISGILQSRARLVRFQHNDAEHLETLLQRHQGRRIHLVTESVYSMDGDYPDLRSIASLKQKYPFNWFLDEAHAVGWYGQTGAGLAQEQDILSQVDILTGTLGKTLASAGAYTVFRHQWMRDLCINEAGEFIYSTYLPPASAAIAQAAIRIVREQSQDRQQWRTSARRLRQILRQSGWDIIGEDSPIVPVICGESTVALSLSAKCLERDLKVAAIRPPTVPKGAARLRLSLKSTLQPDDYRHIVDALGQPCKDND